MKLAAFAFVLLVPFAASAGDARQEVVDIVSHAQALDDASRVHGAPLTMQFKALGPKALAPMLEQIAKGAPSGLSPSARDALRHGMIEAVGMLRDKSATPTLIKAMAIDRDRFAAAEALARIGDDAAWNALKKASGDGEVLRAIGSCRRIEATKLLAAKLDAKPDADTAQILVRALGTNGNAAAWQALKDRTDEAAVREAAARSVMKAYLRYDGAVRQAASNALLVIDWSGMRGLLDDAKASGTPVDALEKRLAKNPTRSTSSP